MSDFEKLAEHLMDQIGWGASESDVIQILQDWQAARSEGGEVEPVATLNEANCFSIEDASRIMALGPGTKLYTHPQPTTVEVPEGWRSRFIQTMGEIQSELEDADEDSIPSELWALWRELTATPQPEAGAGEWVQCPRCHSDCVDVQSSREMELSEIICSDCAFGIQAPVDEDTLAEMWKLIKTESCAEHEEYAEVRQELAEIDRPNPPEEREGA